MQVFKFGGASIQDAERIRNMANIIKSHIQQPLLLVISALGKTTNALEQVAQAYNKHDANAAELFALIEAQHNALAQDLMDTTASQACIAQLQQIYAEADWILHSPAVREADYNYDQLVCLGELMSTTIISHYFNTQGIANVWQDVRDIIISDSTWRDAGIHWAATQQNVTQKLLPLLLQHNVCFIAATTDNESTTLGREGSDYTGAVLANMLSANNLSIWKDVKGLLNGDPKIFKNLEEIKTISYYEVIEMAYYGAQVIHPKSIKPLQNKQIPLYVKCFLQPQFEGTCITENVQHPYPPIYVLKTNQTLLQVYSKDFSFITDDKLSEIYSIFHDLHVRINIIQNAAISFLACIDHHQEKVDKLYKALEANYKIVRNDDVSLLTIRHYTQQAIDENITGKTVLLEQKSRSTVQYILK
jgi:aspartate kinase